MAMFLPRSASCSYQLQHLEGAHSSPGRHGLAFEAGGALCAVTVCEDLWLSNGPAGRAARGGATVILNISSSPYHVGKALVREEMLRTRARDELVDHRLLQPRRRPGRAGVRRPVGGRRCRRRHRGAGGGVRGGGARLRGRPGRRGVGPPARHAAAAREGAPAARAARDARSARTAVAPGAEHRAARSVGGSRSVGGAVPRAARLRRQERLPRVVLGLSGGIDSALVAALAADALGPARVAPSRCPRVLRRRRRARDARRRRRSPRRRLRRELPIECSLRTGALAPAVRRTRTGVAEENLQARIRGRLLMALSNKFGSLVLATGEQDGDAVGYATLYGDMAGGFAPIKDVPKTLVYELCRWRNEQAGGPPPIPSVDHRQAAVGRAPAGPARHRLAPAVRRCSTRSSRPTSRRTGRRRRSSRGACRPRRWSGAWSRMVDRAEYKRRQAPPGVKITPKAFGRDRRMPITNAFR